MIVAAITLGYRVDEFEQKLSHQVNIENSEALALGHAISCALKVRCSELACAAIESCRRVR